MPMPMPKSLGASLLAAALLAACGGSGDDAATAPLTPAPPATQQQLLDLVNTARSQPRLCGTDAYAAAPALAWSPALHNAADAHARDMATRQYFAHVAPPPAPHGATVADRAERFGYSRDVGENIAAGHPTAEAAMQAWLNSPGHCRNIMNPNYRALGMAYTYTHLGSHRHYWVQNFGL